MDKRLILHLTIMWRCEIMNETKIIGNFFKPRQKAIARYATEAEAIQDNVLRRLVEKAKATERERNMTIAQSKGIRILRSVFRYRLMRKSRGM